MNHAGSPDSRPAGRRPDPLLPIREAGRALAVRHADRRPVEGARTPAGELLVQERADRQRAARSAGRGGARRPAARQRAARRRGALARLGLAGRVGDDEAAPPALAARRPAAAALLLSARSGRDGRLPPRDAGARPDAAPEAGARPRGVRSARPRRQPAARKLGGEGRAASPAGGRAGAARPEADPALRLQDGDRQREDGGDGDARRLGVLQPRRHAGRPALPPPRAGGLPQPDDPGTAARPPAGGSGQLLRGVRPRAVAAAPRTRQGEGAGGQLAPARPGAGGGDGRRGAGEPARPGDPGGVRARPARRSVGRRAAAGPQRRGASRVPAGGGGRRRGAALGRRAGGAAGGDGLGRRPRHAPRRLRHRALGRSVRHPVPHSGQRPSRGVAVPLDRQRLRPRRRHRERRHEDPAAPRPRQHRPSRPEVLPALASRHPRPAPRRAAGRRTAEAGGDLPPGGGRARHPRRRVEAEARAGAPRRPPARTGRRRC